MSEKVILPEDVQPEYKEVSGWVVGGFFFGKDEERARNHGSTHLKCQHGHVYPKSYAGCPTCLQEVFRENYLKKEFREYDGEPCVDWDGDTWFFFEDDLHNHLEEVYDDFPEDGYPSIDLVIGEPIKLSMIEPIDPERWIEELPDDYSLEKTCPGIEEAVKEYNEATKEALDKLNKFIEENCREMYVPGEYRTTYTYKPE